MYIDEIVNNFDEEAFENFNSLFDSDELNEELDVKIKDRVEVLTKLFEKHYNLEITMMKLNDMHWNNPIISQYVYRTNNIIEENVDLIIDVKKILKNKKISKKFKCSRLKYEKFIKLMELKYIDELIEVIEQNMMNFKEILYKFLSKN